jgi:O-antigen ligase
MQSLVSKITRQIQQTVFALFFKIRDRCFIFASLIAVLVYVFPLTEGNFKLLVLSQGLFLLWVGLKFVFKLGEMRFSPYEMIGWWVLGLVLIVNLWINQDNYRVAEKSFQFASAHIAGILAFALAAQWAARNLKPEQILEYLAWMLIPLVILAALLGFQASNRANPYSIHPNWWGETAFGFSLCALAVKRRNFKIIFIIIALLLMYTVQSRGAMLATVISVFTYWILQFRPFGKTALKRLIFAFASVVSILFFLFVMDWLPLVVNFVEERVLLLYDSYRDFDATLAGRLPRWKDSVAIFWENPIFGHGFDTLTKTHNGFLRLAAEGGILLLGIILAFMFSAMLNAWRRRNDLAFAILLGVSAYFMTYPRSLNLNIVGVIFLLSLFRWENTEARRSTFGMQR